MIMHTIYIIDSRLQKNLVCLPFRGEARLETTAALRCATFSEEIGNIAKPADNLARPEHATVGTWHCTQVSVMHVHCKSFQTHGQKQKPGADELSRLVLAVLIQRFS